MPGQKHPRPGQIVARLRGRLAEIDRDLTGLEGAFEGTVQRPFNGDVKAAHRAAHKPGLPAKIDTDSEVRSFILARIETQTYDQIVAAVKATFPADRHVSRSSLHRWWQKTGRFLPPETAQNAGAQSTTIRRS